MKVVLFGATGKAGGCILQELLSRGHHVIAVVRSAGKLSPAEHLTVVEQDLTESSRLAEILAGSDAAVSAYAPPPENTDEIVTVTAMLVRAVEESGCPRLIVVGGAASLYVALGVTLLASGHLPDAWVPIATSHARVLELLKLSPINWTYFSPAAFFAPGVRTGKFRLGKDDLITDSRGQSRISMEDYAIALVDELEKPQHLRERFTIGY